MSATGVPQVLIVERSKSSGTLCQSTIYGLRIMGRRRGWPPSAGINAGMIFLFFKNLVEFAHVCVETVEEE